MIQNPNNPIRTNFGILGLAMAMTISLQVFAPSTASAQEPPFDSTAGTVFDIIQESDQSTFQCLDYKGRGERQIWDKRVDGEPVVNAFLFAASFSDGTGFEIAINPEFETEAAARTEAMRYVKGFGQLPTNLRQGIKKFSVHKGDEGFHAGTGAIIVYADKVDNRLGYNHLEESLFHEAVHASWDAQHRLAPDWKKAQEADGRFVTGYGKKRPEREDLAETALFAYAILHYPDRFPPVDTQDVIAAGKHRIAYIKKLLPPGKPIFHQVAQAAKCAGN